jgi:hypothetical protein
MNLNPLKSWARRQVEIERMYSASITATMENIKLQKENERLKSENFYMMMIIIALIFILIRLLKEVL